MASYFIINGLIQFIPAPHMEEVVIKCENKALILQAIYNNDQGQVKYRGTLGYL